jgi:hypothetical protein
MLSPAAEPLSPGRIWSSPLSKGTKVLILLLHTPPVKGWNALTLLVGMGAEWALAARGSLGREIILLLYLGASSEP